MPRTLLTHLSSRRREPPATELILDALATYRLTRLATVDTLPAAVAVRERVVHWSRASGHPAIEELIGCPWCIGVWIAGGVIALRRGATRWWSPAARLLAFSAASGVVAYYLSDEVISIKVADSDETNADGHAGASHAAPIGLRQ